MEQAPPEDGVDTDRYWPPSPRDEQRGIHDRKDEDHHNDPKIASFGLVENAEAGGNGDKYSHRYPPRNAGSPLDLVTCLGHRRALLDSRGWLGPKSLFAPTADAARCCRRVPVIAILSIECFRSTIPSRASWV